MTLHSDKGANTRLFAWAKYMTPRKTQQLFALLHCTETLTFVELRQPLLVIEVHLVLHCGVLQRVQAWPPLRKTCWPAQCAGHRWNAHPLQTPEWRAGRNKSPCQITGWPYAQRMTQGRCAPFSEPPALKDRTYELGW